MSSLAAHSRPSRYLRAMLATLALAACTGEPPTAPQATPTGSRIATLTCEADVHAGTVQCTAPAAGANATRLSAADGGATKDLIVGGQNVYVTLTSSNVLYAGEVFSFDVTVKNLLHQALGTTDGVTADPNGIRVFFNTQPVATSGSGTIDFVNPVGGGSMADGFATFTASNQPYYQWPNTMLAQGQTTGTRLWRLHVPPTVNTFYFGVYVDAAVQYPNGYVDVTPTPTTTRIGGTRQLTAVVRDALGGATADQSVTWGTSASGVATVSSSGLVSGVSDGTATITATNGARTGSATVVVATASAATTTIAGANFTVGGSSTITVQAKNAAGTNLAVGGDAVVLATDLGALGAVTDNGDGTYTATLTSTSSGTAHVTGTINGATIANSASIVISSNGLVATDDSYPQSVVGNMSTNSANIPYSALTNDAVDPGVTVTFFGNAGVPGTTLHGGTVSMVTSGPNRGQFTYEPAAGYAGSDQFTYTLTGGSATSSATVTLTVSNMVWFVNNNAGACSSACDGRLSHPFTSLGAFAAANGTGAQKPAAGHTIFLYESATSYTGPVTLLNNQVLVGQDATTSLAAITTIAVPSGGAPFPAMNTGGSATTIAGASGGVVLASGASAKLYGLTLATTGGTAIASGAGFGTLSFPSTTADVTINNSGGQALSLSGGSVTGTIAGITASAGNAVSLSGVGTTLTVNGGALTGSAGGPALNVSGSSGTLTLGTTLAQTGAAAVLQVASRTGGTITVSGAISCTSACLGISVTSNTGGTVALTGASSTLSTGANNAITFSTNSAPVALQLSGGGLAVTTSSARGLNISGAGTVTVSGSGNSVTSTSGGTPVFASSPFGTLNFDGAVSATNAPAMDLSGGTVSIGQGAGATIASTNSTGKGLNLSTLTGTATIGGTGITGSTGTGVDVSFGTAAITLNFPVSKTSSGTLVNVASHSTGNVTLGGNLSCTTSCTGMTVANNTSGTITFSGASKAFSTLTSTAVSLTSNGSAAINFTGGGLVIATTTGTGFTATGGGTVTVQGSGDTISTTGAGSGLVVQNTTIGAGGLTFRSITTGPGAANGILLDNTGSTAGLTVSGAGGTCTVAAPTCTGGTIAGTTGSDGSTSSGVFLRNTVSDSLSLMRINGTHQNFGIYARSVSALKLDQLLLNGTYGTAQASVAADSTVAEGALSMDELSGVDSIANSYFANGNWDNIRLHNASAATTLTRLVMTGNTIGTTRNSVNANAGLEVIVDAGTTTVTAQNGSFQGGIHFGAVFRTTGGTANFTVSGNTMTQSLGSAGAPGNVYTGYNHIYLFPTGTDASSGTINYTFANNTMNGALGSALRIRKDVGTWTMTGSITGNTIGTAGVTSSASANGYGIDISHSTTGKNKVLVSGNHLKQYRSAGLIAGVNPPQSSSTAARNGSLHLTIRGNDFTSPDANSSSYTDAVNFNPFSFIGTRHTMCVDLGSNGANNLTGYFDGALPGAPYSVGQSASSDAAGAFFKIVNLVGTYTNDPGGTATTAIDNAWGPPHNTTNGHPSFIDLGTGGLVTTAANDNAHGVACDLFP